MHNINIRLAKRYEKAKKGLREKDPLIKMVQWLSQV